MNALQIIAALVTSPFRIVKIARDYERREVRETVIGEHWKTIIETEHVEDWTRVEPEESASGESEYYRVVRKPR